MTGFVWDVGDTVTTTYTLEVTPDVATVVTAEILAPDGSAAPGTVTGPVGSIYSITLVVNQPGDWVVIWTVEGTGAGTATQVLKVGRLPTVESLPGWAPLLSDVADYIRTRTMDISNPGSDILLGTFNSRTNPDGESVQRILEKAVRSVSAVVPDPPTSIQDLATSAAAIRAAADVELAHPERNADVNVYAQLNSRAELELERLQKAADVIGVGAEALYPRWAMPDPVPWGDENL
jgi:hypothetical protein